jgi:hypothetical protein
MRAAVGNRLAGISGVLTGLLEALRDHLVGAARFELPTPCAQGGFRPRAEMPYFQLLKFQPDGAGWLKVVELC